MPTSYTSLLGLALPVTGELSGTWGDTVNDYITQYLDSAVEGTQTISGSQTSVTLSVTNGTSLSQVGSGSTGSAQYAIINCTGNPASTLTITAPASSRQYLVLNSTSTSQSVIFRGAGPTTGVTLVSGERCIVAWNGSDFVKIATSTADGVTTFSAGTTGFTPSTATSGAVTLAGTLATTNGGTGLTSFTANGVVYASSTSVLTTGSALSFDSSDRLIVGAASAVIGQRLEVVSNTSGGAIGIRGRASDATGVLSWHANAAATEYARIQSDNTSSLIFGLGASGTEQMRLTSTGLGIGTSSPNGKLDVASGNVFITQDYELNWHTGGTKRSQIIGDSSNNLKFSNRVGGVLTNTMTLDSSGNLGLGVTPSAWSSSVASQVGYGAALSSRSAGNTASDMTHGAYWNGTNWLYQYSSVGAARYQMTGANGGSTHAWFVSAGGTAGNAISFTQAMTLDAGGRLLLGVTSAAGNAGFQLKGASSGYVRVEGTSSTMFAGDAPQLISGAAAQDSAVRAEAALLFATGGANERARITSTGQFGLGVTSPQAMFDLAGDYKEGVVTANTGTAYTINTANGTLQILTLTGNCTFTFPTAVAGESFTLLLRQDGTGGRTVTWPAAVRWPGNTAPTITSTASQTDKYIFTADGTRWYGSNAGQAYVA